MNEFYIMAFSIIIFFSLLIIFYCVFYNNQTNTPGSSINVINPFYLQNPPELELNDSLIERKLNTNFHNFSIYHTNSEEECIICLEPLNTGKIINLGCLHKYHLDCLVSWWQKDIDKTSCPVCRTKNYLA